MSLFRDIRGQDQAVAILESALRSNRLAHAYLLAGPPGTGRLSIALALAASRICAEKEHGYCGSCSHCSRIFRFEHPDVRITIPQTASIGPDQVRELLINRRDDGITPLRFPGNTYISISQVREIERRLARKSFEGKGHVEILIDADRILLQGANALLKTIEEPPDGTLLVLTSSFYSRIIPTIRSRTHLVRLGRISEKVIADELVRRRELDGVEAARIAAASDGSIGNALVLSTSDTDTDIISTDVFRELAKCTSSSRVSNLASRLVKEMGREGLLDLCREIRFVVHDRRRTEAGCDPLGGNTGSLLSLADDTCLDSISTLFSTCESRLSRNVMPSMALHAALLGSWKSVNGGN